MTSKCRARILKDTEQGKFHSGVPFPEVLGGSQGGAGSQQERKGLCIKHAEHMDSDVFRWVKMALNRTVPLARLAF